VAAVEVVTPSLKVVELCLGGLDSSFSGQEVNQDSQDLLVQKKGTVMIDAGDVKICVSLQKEINY
jgi:hypothetical protein